MDPSDPLYNVTCGLARIAGRVDADVSAEYLNFDVFLLVVLPLYYIMTLCIFRYYQPEFPWLKKRSLILIIVFDFGCLSYIILSPVRDSVGWEKFPCDLEMWLRNFGTYMMLGVLTLRFIFFRNQLAWARALDKVNYKKLQEIAKDEQSKINSNTGTGGILGRKSVVAPPMLRDVLADTSFRQDNSSGVSDGSETHSYKNESVISSSIETEDFKKAYFRSTMWYNCILIVGTVLAPPLVLSIAFQFGFPYYGQGCVNCLLGFRELFLLLASGAGHLAMLSITAFRLRKEADPLGILRELKLVILAIGLPGTGVFLFFIEEFMGKPYSRAVFSADWLICIGLPLVHFFLCPYQVYLAVASRKRHRALHSGAPGGIDLKSILGNPTSYALFSKHVVSEFSVENIRFHTQAKSYRDHFLEMKSANTAAIQIVNTFIRPGAIMEVNIPSKMRETILEHFRDGNVVGETSGNNDTKNTIANHSPTAQGGGLSTTLSSNSLLVRRDVFLEAEIEIFNLMKRDSLPRFIQTPEFKAFAESNIVVSGDGEARLV